MVKTYYDYDLGRYVDEKESPMTNSSQPIPASVLDELAQEIRRVDGDNTMGAGQLAEALLPFLARIGMKAERS